MLTFSALLRAPHEPHDAPAAKAIALERVLDANGHPFVRLSIRPSASIEDHSTTEFFCDASADDFLSIARALT